MNKNKKYNITVGIIVVIIFCYLVTNNIIFNVINPKEINENGFQANLFVKENIKNKTAVIFIGGGQWGDYWAKKIAEKQFVGLSLPYVGRENLPNLPEEIDLEYFEKAIKWLGKQESVNPKKIIVMGASRNAELAVLIASIFPDIISGVVAYSPSSVSWSNTVLPYNSDELKASWRYSGVDIPYVAMEKISGNNSDKIKMLEYWESGLSEIDSINNAFIKVELIKGPILLFSGMDDKVWPSAKMANMITKRLKNKKFNYSFKNIKYENTGHLISNNPEQYSGIRTGKINIDGKSYEYEFGGTNDGDFEAKKDAKTKLMEFLGDI